MTADEPTGVTHPGAARHHVGAHPSTGLGLTSPRSAQIVQQFAASQSNKFTMSSCPQIHVPCPCPVDESHHTDIVIFAQSIQSISPVFYQAACVCYRGAKLPRRMNEAIPCCRYVRRHRERISTISRAIFTENETLRVSQPLPLKRESTG